VVNNSPAPGKSARRLEGRTLGDALALVTGAGSGIGRATSLALAGAGARIIAVDIDEDAAANTAAACRERGRPAESYRCDVADWDAMAALAERIEGTHGPLDVLVNNAGVGMTGRFNDLSIDDWRWIRSINLDGVVHGCRAFGPGMVARGSGQVVNVSSGLGFTPRATEPAYVTTKAAVLALSQCLRADWGTKGVGVSVICPGVINTPIITSTRYVGLDADAPAKAQKLFKRIGHKPEIVAKAIVDAIRRDRALVAPGFESRLGWYAHRFVPIRGQQIIARRDPF